MCLIFFAYNSHPKFSIIIAGNRDEFLDRPSAKIDKWEGIYGGRDLKSGGTWLGITKESKFCAITNIRSTNQKPDAPTRGKIVTNYLKGKKKPEEYLKDLIEEADLYNGFNLILGDRKHIFHFNNSEMLINKLSPGIYGVSNATLDTPWPKLTTGKRDFEKLLRKDIFDPEEYFSFLNNRTKPPFEELPDTGVGEEWEKVLSSVFIESESYGTRCSSLITIDKEEVNFFERTFDKGKKGDRKISFKIS